MKFYLSNKSNLKSNSNVDNLYKNKNYDRTKKKKKETHVDNRGFGFWVEISTNFFFFLLLYMTNKASLFFLEKNQSYNLCLQPRDKFLFGMLYINLLNLKGFIWFCSRIWGFHKFGS